MRNWDRLIDKLAEYDRARGIKESTVKNRQSELYKWGIWLKRRRPRVVIDQIDIELIHQYIKSRTAFLSKGATCAVIGSMRQMGDLLVEDGFWKQNPLRWISGPKINNTRKIPKNYHRSDLKKIFEQSFNAQIPFFRKLYPAIISVFYTTGIRKSELLELNLGDWDRQRSVLKIYGSKTSVERFVPVPEIAWKCIENYLAERTNRLQCLGAQTEALFINSRGRRVNGSQILVQFKRIAKQAGVGKATIHMFRHSCATGLIEQGVPLVQVKQVLGHACPQTTFRYLNIADPERKKAIKQHPITKIMSSLEEEVNANL